MPTSSFPQATATGPPATATGPPLMCERIGPDNNFLILDPLWYVLNRTNYIGGPTIAVGVPNECDSPLSPSQGIDEQVD